MGIGQIVAMVMVLVGCVLGIGAAMGLMYLMGDNAVSILLGIFAGGLVMLGFGVAAVNIAIAIDD